MNVLSRALGATWSPPPQHGASRSSSEPHARALGRQSRHLLPWEAYRCRKAAAGIPVCLFGGEVLGKQETGTRRMEPSEPTAGILAVSC